jgi:RNA polymerase sigma-70 factor (ECF subfamily)
VSDAADPDLRKIEETLFQVRAARGGNAQALNSLFARYLPRVQQIVALRLNRPLRECWQEIQDLAQESMLEAFLHLDRFEQGSEGSFRNWIATIVVNNVRDASRRSAAQKRGAGKVKPMADAVEDSSEGMFVQDSRPSAVLYASELEEARERALLELTERHREAVILRHLCEMSYEEMADTMRLKSVAAARALSHRATDNLRELMRKYRPDTTSSRPRPGSP